MKKTLCMLLLVTICIMMSGCSKSVDNAENSFKLVAIEMDGKSALYDGYNTSNSADSLQQTIFHDETAPETVTVEFEGKEYTGTYDYSYYDSYRINQGNTYKLGDMYFSVSAENGKLLGITLDPELSGDKTLEECRSIAKSVAGKYIDTDKYNLEEKTGDRLHFYTYKRHLHGQETAEYLSVIVTSSGEISSFNSSMLGSFDSANLKKNTSIEYVETLCSPEAENIATNKAKSVIGKEQMYKNTEKICLIALPDGTVGMAYDINFEKRVPTNEGFVYVESFTKRVLVKEE